MLAGYSRQDAPPSRVKPLPVPILRHVMAQAVLSQTPFDQAQADLICLAFFFLLRPGEYAGASSDARPFLFSNVHLFFGNQRLDSATAPADHLLTATFVTLEFTSQKNGVAGEVMGLGRSGDPNFCPVVAAARRLIHLRQAAAPPHQPIASFFSPTTQRWQRILPRDLTAVLRLSVTVLGPTYGLTPHDVSARSLRSSGAMALLCANVDSDRIKMVGRWKTDEMFRYLHTQAEPVMRQFSTRMITGGHFTLLPHHDVPLL
jgi:hypothetical protein